MSVWPKTERGRLRACDPVASGVGRTTLTRAAISHLDRSVVTGVGGCWWVVLAPRSAGARGAGADAREQAPRSSVDTLVCADAGRSGGVGRSGGRRCATTDEEQVRRNAAREQHRHRSEGETPRSAGAEPYGASFVSLIGTLGDRARSGWGRAPCRSCPATLVAIRSAIS